MRTLVMIMRVMPAAGLPAATLLPCAALVIALLSLVVAGECPPSGCRVQGLYTTHQVLEAGVNGTTYEGYKYWPNITSAEGCIAACMNRGEMGGNCNIWSYCGKDGGCGRWCNLSKEYGCTKENSQKVPKNWCTLRSASGYYEYKNIIAEDVNGPKSFTSGKINSRAPKKPILPMPVSGEWKCSKDYACQLNLYENEPFCKTKPTCASSNCHAVLGLYDTPKIIAPEVGSFSPYRGGNHPPSTTSAAKCCSACSTMKACNVWNYCWNPAGCGALGSCDAYTEKWPVTRNYSQSEFKPPLTRGPYGFRCTPDGRFPQYFCILRQAGSDLKTLKRSGPQGYYSWTSGKLIAE